MIRRIQDLTQYKHSLFLFGPRQVGKTYLIKNTLTSDLFIDLLKHQDFLRYTKDVSLLSQEVNALKQKETIIVIDEIQRCPELLNEIHYLIEKEKGIKFILTGSSARKLRRTGINLLGGRAITLHLHPLTHIELADTFRLDHALHFGTLPNIVLENNLQEKSHLLNSYVETYLKEEIQQEALTRNLPAFAKFIELAAYENGNILNFQNLAREIGIHSKTIKEYFAILEDTLLGFFLYPYTHSSRKRLISHPKFYFFDCGVVTTLRKSLTQELIKGTPNYGDAFEHFIMLEIKRLLDYYSREVRLSFFRTSDGAEVDLILEINQEIWAIEIKSSSSPRLADLRGLRSFMKDHPYKRAICVCQTPRPYLNENIEFLPWQIFLTQL